MKKTAIILAFLALGVMLQAQTGTVLIFQAMLPVEVVQPPELTDQTALAIWDEMKVFRSPVAYWDTGTGYSYSDVRRTFKDAKEIFQDFILPFVGGVLIKTEPDVYWDPATEKLAFRDYWRTAHSDTYVLDIVRIYLDYDSSAFN